MHGSHQNGHRGNRDKGGCGVERETDFFFITDPLLVLQAIDGFWEWSWRLTRTLSATSDLISRRGVKVTIGPTVDLG